MTVKYTDLKAASFEDQFTDEVKHERELIRRVQLYDDKMAMKELLRLFRGIINQQASNPKVLNVADKETALSVSEGIVKSIIKDKFDLSMPNKPSTYIQGNLTNGLLNYIDSNRETITRRPAELSRFNAYDQIAKSWLTKMDIEATPEASDKFIKEEMGKGGKNLSSKQLETSRAMDRRELSGDRAVGGAETAGVDVMSFSEMLQPKGELNAEEEFNNFFKRKQIETIIASPEFSRGERKYIRQIAGIGEFSGKPAMNRNQAALNAGITYAQGTSVIKKVQSKLNGGV